MKFKRRIRAIRRAFAGGDAHQRGQVIVIVAMVLVGLIAAMGLAVDVALLQVNRAQLSAYVDAASLAGAEELPDTNRARERAEQYLILHGVTPGDTTNPSTDCYIEFPAPGPEDQFFQDEAIDVRCKRPVNTAFIRVVGINSVNVPAYARTLATSIWQAEQTWTMFRGGPGRTGFQPCDGATASDGLEPPVQQVGFEWGFRWDSNDTQNHRSTPAIYRKVGLFDSHAIAVHGSNGTTKGGADDYSGVYAWDTVNGTGSGIYVTSTDDGYSDGLRTLPAGASTDGLLWFNPLDTGNKPDVRSSPLILDPLDPALGGDDIPDSFNDGYAVVFVGAHDGKVYALDIRDGDVIWVTDNTNDSYLDDGLYRSSPAFYRMPGESRGYIYQATSRGNVYKIDLLDGSIVWRSAPFPSDYPVGSLPAEHGGDPNKWDVPIRTGAGDNIKDYWGQAPIYGTVNVARLPIDSTSYGGYPGTLNDPSDDIPTDVVFVISHGKDDFQDGTKRTPFLYAINAADGRKLWEARTADGSAVYQMGTDTNTNDRNSAVVGIIDVDFDGLPVVDSDGVPADPDDEWRVFGAPTDGYIYGFHANTGRALSDHTWNTGISPDTGLVPPNPRPGSTYTGNKSHRSDPDLYCGVIFGGTEGFGMYAISAITGDSIWDGTDSDGVGFDEPNPWFEAGASPGDCASASYNVDQINVYNCYGTRAMPGGVKSSPAVLSGIILAGTNDPAETSGGAVWALSAKTGEDLGHWDTGSYTSDGGLGPTYSSGGGDVRSGVVVGPDNKAYWGSADGGIYQLFVNELLVLAK